MELNKDINRYTAETGDFNAIILPLDRSTRQKLKSDRGALRENITREV